MAGVQTEFPPPPKSAYGSGGEAPPPPKPRRPGVGAAPRLRPEDEGPKLPPRPVDLLGDGDDRLQGWEVLRPT